jgi:hypothetical protein
MLTILDPALAGSFFAPKACAQLVGCGCQFVIGQGVAQCALYSGPSHATVASANRFSRVAEGKNQPTYVSQRETEVSEI